MPPMSEHERDLIEGLLRVLCPAPEGAGGSETPPRDQGAVGALIQFMNEMPGGFLIYRADRGEEIIYANRALLRIFQCDSMEQFRALTGNSFRGLVYPEDLEAVEDSIRAQIAASQYDLDYVEYRICRRDGAVRWIEDYGHFVHSNAVGDIFYVFLGDATEKHRRLQTEKSRLVREKREKEERIQTLIQEYDKERSLINQEYLRQLEVIEGLSINYEAICYVDLDRDQVVPYRLSPRNRVLFDGEHQPRPYAAYAAAYAARWIHPDDREMVARFTAPDYIREKLSREQTYYFNYRVLAEDEAQFFQLRVVNVGRGGGVNQVVLGYRRVDEEIRLQMEQQALLSQALARANSAIASKNTFLSNMSHDMRTPLHAIFGFTSLAKLNLGNPQEAGEYLDRVEAAGRQLLDMIDKVLEMSALSAGGGVEESGCDLSDIAREVCDSIRPRAREQGVALALDCAGLRQSAVCADRDKLRRLILCLADNAVAYTNAGGRVDIRLEQLDELPNGCAIYRLSVADTGIGISPEFLKRVFEPFSREKNSTHSGIHGVGLGLTIAKNIVDMMGGSIHVDSTVGRGSTFTVSLTLHTQPAQPAPDAAPASAPAREQAPARPVRILLAEDNDLNREIETELLERQGFVIDPVENGRIALAKMEQAALGDYDLILMDLQMPVMDGWQAAAAIRALPDPAVAAIPIIALSANSLDGDQMRSREAGINAHLSKPMDLPLLLRTIQELIGAAQLS